MHRGCQIYLHLCIRFPPLVEKKRGFTLRRFPNNWIMYLFNRLWAAYWLWTDWVTRRICGKSRKKKRRRPNQGHVCKEPCGQTNVFRRNSCRLGHADFTFALRETFFNLGPRFLQMKTLSLRTLGASFSYSGLIDRVELIMFKMIFKNFSTIFF